jgi:outer membrane protein TolC
MNLRTVPSLLGIGSLAFLASLATRVSAAIPMAQANVPVAEDPVLKSLSKGVPVTAANQSTPLTVLIQPSLSRSSAAAIPPHAVSGPQHSVSSLPGSRTAPRTDLPRQNPTPPRAIAQTPETVPGLSAPTPAANLLPFQQQNLEQLRDPVLDNLQANPNPLQFPTQPQEVQIETIQPLTLQQTVELAKQNSPVMQRAQLGVDRGQARIDEAWAAYYPSANFRANARRFGQGQGTTTLEGANRPADNTTNGSFNFPNNYVLNGSTDLGIEFNVNYNLYDPARQPNLNAAQAELRQAKLDYERIWEDLQQRVSTGYFDLQAADEIVRIRLDAVRASEQSLKDADALLRAGVGTKFDVLQAQVRLSSDQQNLVLAVGNQAVARRALAQLLNLPQSVQPQAADPVQRVGDWALSLDESIVLAFQNRAELQRLLEERDLRKNLASAALAQTQPVLSLVGSSGVGRGWSDNINTVGGLDATDRRFQPARRVNQTTWGYDYSLGLQVQWNFYDGGQARAQAQQQLIGAQDAEEQFSDTRTQIRLQVEQAFYGLQSNLSNIGTTYKGVEQAQEALRLARLRFQAGVGTQTDVINQQRDLTTAQGQYLNAITEYNKSLTDMKRAVSNWPPIELQPQAKSR